MGLGRGGCAAPGVVGVAGAGGGWEGERVQSGQGVGQVGGDGVGAGHRAVVEATLVQVSLGRVIGDAQAQAGVGLV